MKPAAEAASDSQSWGRQRVRSRTSLFASGEPMVWLTGGALVVCTAMVIALLGIVLFKGLGTFWSMAVERLETADGRVYMGEVTRRETYRPSEVSLEGLDAASAERARELTRSEGENARRALVRTGNFRLTQNHFTWVSGFEVGARDRPEWALLVERREWGRFYGFPEAFALLHPLPEGDAVEEARRLLGSLQPQGGRVLRLVVKGAEAGQRGDVLLDPAVLEGGAAPAIELEAVAEVALGPETAWTAFREHHADVRDRWRERRGLEKHETGVVNHRQEQARLDLRKAELELEEVVRKGESTSAHARALEAHAQAEARYAEARAQADQDFARIREEIDAINSENGRYRLVMRTAGEGTDEPWTTLLRLDDIVRAYPANQLGFFGKVGTYLGRWKEFLLDEPREANSEGGVFPAIFGTVAMTLIMSLAVVPFGVLAALYLREYAKAGPLVSAVRIAVNNLAGVPSIVFGVFGLGFFCYVVGASLDQLFFAAHLPNPTFGKGGLLWASFTLALLTLPVVIVATEEAVAAVPSSMREGSYACGASKWQTIQRIVLPRAMPGIITGMVLAIARGAGEVAPLMLVGAVKLAPELPIDGILPFVHPERSFMHLGFHIYDVGFQSQNSEAAKPMVYTTTLLLISIVALLNLATIALRSRLRRKFAGGKF